MLMKSPKSLRLTGILAAACFVAVGCASEQEHTPCDGITCSGHGRCEVVGDQPICRCDQGFEVSPNGLSCVLGAGPCEDQSCSGHGACLVDMMQQPFCDCDSGFMQDPCNRLACIPERCRETGEPCTDSSQCCGNFCLKLYVGVEEGFCTTRDCNTHEDCRNHCDDNKEMCCTNLGGESYMCLKINEGCGCGDQTGTCGTDCGCQSLTACEPGLQCFANVCSISCMTNEDCSECRDPDNIDTEFECSPISGGDTYCMASNPDVCRRSGDCDDNEVCIPFSNAAGDGFAPSCGRVGDKDTGEICDSQADPNALPESERCAGFYCMSDHCSEVCIYETDCPENMLCAISAFRFEGSGDDTLEIGLCQWADGSQTDCAGNDDCPDGEMCTHFAISPNQSLVKVCVDENCDRDTPNVCSPPGTEGCGDEDAPPCWGGLCLVYTNGESFCSAECDTFEDCPEYMDCALLPVTDELTTGVCVPTSSGTSDAGEPCIFGEVWPDADDCMPGMVCLGYQPGINSPDCTENLDCYGDFPESHNPYCANGKCGGSFCSPRCDEQGQCEPGFDPADVSGLCYCIPGEPPGESGPGDPCPFGQTNAEADNCRAELECLGFNITATSPDCSVDEDCDEPMGIQNNPDCVDGKCGASFCSAPCGANDECDPGFEPVDVSGSCYCVPSTPAGNSGPGDPCPYNQINTDADNCQAGLSCLAYPIDATSPTCTLDGDCTDPMGGPQYNPDCVDGQCGASFCSAPCGANDECDAGFEPNLVNDKCYCVPAETPGNSGPGDPCPFGGVNASSENCQADLHCLGVDAGATTPACGVALDCTSDPEFHEEHNPDCVDGHCGVSFCAAECGAGDTCDAGFEPFFIDTTCYCQPMVFGKLGDPCPYDTVNADANDCGTDLTCLGVPADGASGTCPSDVSECTDLTVNVDCVGGNCGASYCAELCGAGDTCPTGYTPHDEGGTCYCIPES